MGKVFDISGQTFGEWTALERYTEEIYPTRWICKCSCGVIRNVLSYHLRKGISTHCGCISENRSKAHTKHGGYKDGNNTPTYQSFIAMMHRCYDPKRNSWDNYGGRGIVVSESRWLEETPNGYLNFVEDMGERPEGTTLDRIDSNGNYCKDNCRWADRRTQAVNTNRKKTVKNTSKYRGVSFRKSNGKYMARIGNGLGGYTWLGEFVTEVEAAIAYNKTAKEIHGDEAVLNIIDENAELDTILT